MLYFCFFSCLPFVLFFLAFPFFSSLFLGLYFTCRLQTCLQLWYLIFSVSFFLRFLLYSVFIHSFLFLFPLFSSLLFSALHLLFSCLFFFPFPLLLSPSLHFLRSSFILLFFLFVFSSSLLFSSVFVCCLVYFLFSNSLPFFCLLRSSFFFLSFSFPLVFPFLLLLSCLVLWNNVPGSAKQTVSSKESFNLLKPNIYCLSLSVCLPVSLSLLTLSPSSTPSLFLDSSLSYLQFLYFLFTGVDRSLHPSCCLAIWCIHGILFLELLHLPCLFLCLVLWLSLIYFI